MIKVLCLYLPQFHQTKENDLWWGEGFTEWNVVKSAKRINKYTFQPRVPIQGYYDLSDCNSIRNQAKLAKQYGVSGFVIYSYYSNGQLLLETPSELLLRNKDIDISFCFSWANHDWKRTWFSYNKQMLRKQEYARNAEDVSNHFLYYLPFFKDSRYIKIDNRPVLFIYDYEAIPDFSIYVTVFNKLAKENGFDGVYFVQTLGGHHLSRCSNWFDAYFEYEPTYTTFSQMKLEHKINRFKRGVKQILKSKALVNYFDYSKTCNYMESRECADSTYILGSFAEWDNTPRHSHNGTVFKGFSTERFEKNIKTQLHKAASAGAPFIVIDAWNEWGEGAFMEPDEKYGFSKLEAIKKAVESCSNT